MLRERRLVARTGLLDPGEQADSLPTVSRQELAAATSSVVRLRHAVRYRYEAPVSGSLHRLVVLPMREHGDQVRVEHRFEALVDGIGGAARVHRSVDEDGNEAVTVRAGSVMQQLEFRTTAVVSRRRGGPSPSWHGSTDARVTDLTRPDDAIVAAAAQLPRGGSVTDRAWAAMHAVRERITYTPGSTTVRTSAVQAWELGRGVCQDLAHAFVALCAVAGIPARYVSGHLVGEGASHAWVEVFDPASGVVTALDPTHDRATDLRYLTVATGRDYLDVAPTRGTVTARAGAGGRLTIEKSLHVVAVASSDG